jgi:hypothetical protein
MATQWRRLEMSDIAQKGESIDALRALPHEELVRLAYGAFETLKDADKYSYAISYLEEHLENEGDLLEGWVLAQADKDGGWNKWAKSLGGYSPDDCPGDYLIFSNWQTAKDALNHIDPSFRQYSRIYPVVLSAGREPRTTPPR